MKTTIPTALHEIAGRAAGADALLVSAVDPIPADLIRALPDSVRMIATFSVGTDHIDLAAAKERGIAVSNTPGVLTDATADIAFLLLLGAARRASEGERLIREGRWEGWAPTQLVGVHVTGKRLAILGMGRIGQAVARRARGFDMEIHYHNRRRLPADEEAGAIYHADADDLLSVADFLSIHSPATPETHHWLNAERIARLPDRAVVVNTARGSVVDDEALIAALRSGKLAAAGLDVFENEPRLHPGYAATAEHLPAAAPGQRHRPDPRRHGLHGAGQPRRLLRRRGTAQPRGLSLTPPRSAKALTSAVAGARHFRHPAAAARE